MSTDPERVRAAINRTIGRKIAKTMAVRGVSRAQLAEAIGTTEARVARALKGSSYLTAAELVMASRFMSVPLQSLGF